MQLRITGDLTMRARRREFAAATRWISALGVPVTVEVGNHDLPDFDLIERFTDPYRRHRALEMAVERPIALPGVAVIPLKTTARAQLRLNWSKGRVGLTSPGRLPGRDRCAAAWHASAGLRAITRWSRPAHMARRSRGAGSRAPDRAGAARGPRRAIGPRP